MIERSKKNVENIFPLTAMQKGMLVHAVDAGEFDPYLVKLCFRFDSPMDTCALEQALQTMVDRHQSLRADIEWTKTKEPVQIVYRRCPIALEKTRSQATCPASRRAELRKIQQRMAEEFALNRAAGLRVTWVDTVCGPSYLLWVFHHALIDGWSVATVLEEVLSIYLNQDHGRSLDPPLPYSEYIRWLGGRSNEESEQYWANLLAGLEESTTFPPRSADAPDSRGSDYAEQSLLLEEADSERIRIGVGRSRTTPNNYFRAVLALLMHRYTGEGDVVFGGTVSGRPVDLADGRVMVGNFINTLPVRLEVDPRQSAEEFLSTIQKQALDSAEHEHVGLPHIQSVCGFDRGHPLFETILVFENLPVAQALESEDALGGAFEDLAQTDGQVRRGRGRNNYPFSMVVIPGQRIEIVLAYHRPRVTDKLARKWLACIGQLARGLVELGEQPLSRCLEALDLPLSLANPPSFDDATFSPDERLLERVRRWVRETPDAVAARDAQMQLTYGELWTLSRRLASLLARKGRERSVSVDRVAVCLKRSPRAIVSLLAILQCGGAYVFVDPNQPRERLLSMLRESHIALVVAEPDSCEWFYKSDFAVVPANLEHWALEEPLRSPERTHPESAAYMVFTSGSTGVPKAVVVPHRALEAYVSGMLSRLRLPLRASQGLVSTLAADLGNTTLFGSLCTGGTLHVFSEEEVLDSIVFADLMTTWRVEVLKIVPSLLLGLLRAAGPSVLPSHTLVLGGEAATPALLQTLGEQGACRVFNHYGPTETTVGVLTHQLSRDELVSGRPVPLGAPLPHVHVAIRGRHGELMPVGTSGEICIGGSGVACGYWGRPGATSERFVPDPWGKRGSRLYRSGDRGRMREDGTIEFLGRMDSQVKVRGYRVELGEIEGILSRHPRVSSAVATLTKDEKPKLVAYLQGSGSEEEIARFAKDRLPGYMVPSSFIWLERFPVTRNGKVDKARLPRLEVTVSQGRCDLSPVEEVIARAWRELLRVAEVRAPDNFFALGGDSIIALEVSAQVRRAGYLLTPKLLFQHPTLAQLAEVVQPVDKGLESKSAVPKPEGIPLLPLQTKFLQSASEEPHHYNQALLLSLGDGIDSARLADAIALLVERHDALRLRFWQDGRRWKQECAPHARTSVMRWVDLRESSSPRKSLQISVEEEQRSLDLKEGALFRAVHYRLAEEEGARLLLLAHHLAVDGVSWRILLDDLGRIYGSLTAGNELDLEEPGVTLAEWGSQLARWGKTDELCSQIPFWREVLRPRPREERASEAPFPTHGDANSNTVGNAKVVSDELGPDETGNILTRTPLEYGATINQILLAALCRAFAHKFCAKTLLVLMEGHGRVDPIGSLDASRTVGWLSCAYPLRLPLGLVDGFERTLGNVKTCLERVPSEGLGFGVLRYLTGDFPVEATEEEPLVTLNYLGQFDGTFERQELFRPADESHGSRRSPLARRDTLLVINALVYERCLTVDLEYCGATMEESSAAEILGAFMLELQGIAASCGAGERERR